ncbi:hypothetical protein ACOJBO_02275 [Rhizobium beringeri]
MMMKKEENHHMAIEKELLDQLLAGRDPSEVFGKDGLLDDLKRALSERILNAELDDISMLSVARGPVPTGAMAPRGRQF